MKYRGGTQVEKDVRRRRIVELRAQGMGWAKIGRLVGMGRSNVYHMLNRPRKGDRSRERQAAKIAVGTMVAGAHRRGRAYRATALHPHACPCDHGLAQGAGLHRYGVALLRALRAAEHLLFEYGANELHEQLAEARVLFDALPAGRQRDIIATFAVLHKPLTPQKEE